MKNIGLIGHSFGGYETDYTLAFYNGLSKNKKDVVALFYKDEGHSIHNRKAQLDLTSKILDWFDFHLKGQNEVEWIERGTMQRVDIE